jgi:hypothetical protein
MSNWIIKERKHQYPGYISFTFFSDKFFLLIALAIILVIFQILFSDEINLEKIIFTWIECLMLLYVLTMRKQNFQFINGMFSAYKIFYDSIVWKTFSKEDYLWTGDDRNEGFITNVIKKALILWYLKAKKK